jgi:hypothetical protein
MMASALPCNGSRAEHPDLGSPYVLMNNVPDQRRVFEPAAGLPWMPRRDGGTSTASLILEVIPFYSLSGQIKRNV